MIKFSESKAEVEELTLKSCEYLEFLLNFGAIDGTHIEIKERKENYSDFIT